MGKPGLKFVWMSSGVAVLTTSLFFDWLLNLSYVHAQLAQKPSLFEDVTISPQFSPNPLILHGVSGGLVSGKTIAGRSSTDTGLCVGFMDEKPDHTMVLTAFFRYLRMVVQAPENTTMVIKGPGGTWCKDNYEGFYPGISGQWLPGTYEIWIGSYNKTKYIPYIIKITDQSPAGATH
jgi:hypothetical protein